MATTVQEPNDIPESEVTDENAHNIAVVVYEKATDGAGLKKLGLAPWKTFLGYDSDKADNIATLIGFTDEEYKPGGKIPTPDETLRQQLQAVADQAGVTIHPTIVTTSVASRVEALEHSVDGYTESGTTHDGLLTRMTTAESDIDALQTTVGDSSSGLVKDVKKNQDDISDLQTAIGTGGGGSSTGLTSRVSALETTVGDSTKGLVKDTSDLKTTVGNSSSGLVKNVATNTSDISTLKTTVGDSSSGLVKDVTDLQTTVGDSSSGLVKNVSTLKTTVGDSSSGLVKNVTDLQTTVGDSSNGLVANVATNTNDIAALKSTASSAFKYSGNVNSADELTILTSTLTKDDNGKVYNINYDGGTYKKGANIAWVWDSDTDSGSWDELGTAIDVTKVDELSTEVDTLNTFKDTTEARYNTTTSTAASPWESSTLVGTYLLSVIKSNQIGLALLNSTGPSSQVFSMISGDADTFFSDTSGPVVAKANATVTATKIS